MSVIRNTEVTVIRSQLCNTSNGHASGTPANRPYNGGVRNSEARNIEVPLYIHFVFCNIYCPSFSVPSSTSLKPRWIFVGWSY